MYFLLIIFFLVLSFWAFSSGAVLTGLLFLLLAGITAVKLA